VPEGALEHLVDVFGEALDRSFGTTRVIIQLAIER
jgi:hypothetical protein